MEHAHVIGFYGVAQAGKSTAAAIAASTLRDAGYKVLIRSFAGPLKEGLVRMGIHKDKDPELYRAAAQYMGTEICREYDPDWWVNQMRREVETRDASTVIIVDDCRFPNELDYLHSIGATMIFIMAGHRADLSLPMYSHPSESVAVAHEGFFGAGKDGVTLPRPSPFYQPDHIIPNYTDISFLSAAIQDIMLKLEVHELD